MAASDSEKKPRERCEFSELFTDECAHCLGHKPDWEPKRTYKIDYSR